MRKILRSGLGVTLMLLATIVLFACKSTVSGPLIEGRVLERETNAPISDAIVVVSWRGTIGGIGHGGTVCYHVETATTDLHGAYRITAWEKLSPYGDIAHRHWFAMAYRSGYEYVTSDHATVYLKPFTGEKRERLEYLSRSAVGCSDKYDIEIKMLPFYKALYAESQSLAVTKDDQKIADGFLSNIEMIELGYDVAMKRALERAEKRKQQP